MKSLVKFSATFLMTVLIVTTICLNVGAAGGDDGTATMTKKSGVVYFGTQKDKWCMNFIASDKSGKSFLRYNNVDISGDGMSNLSDLVCIAKSKPTDINSDGLTNSDDVKVVRRFLLGKKDFEN